MPKHLLVRTHDVLTSGLKAALSSASTTEKILPKANEKPT